jgi:hypothetical protein
MLMTLIDELDTYTAEVSVIKPPANRELRAALALERHQGAVERARIPTLG